MGWAWVAAAAIVYWALRRPSASAARAALVAAPAAFLVAALWSAQVAGPAARFTLEGLAFPYASDPQKTPLLHLGAPRSARSLTPHLALPGLPAGGDPIELLAWPAVEEQGVTRPARLELRVPDGSPAMVGFDRPEDPFPFSNVVDLRGGETLVVCPGGRGECAERVLKVERSPAGGLKVGPCDLSGEPRRATKPSTWGRRPERTLAVLDLYHYETGRCVPTPVSESTPFWARRDGRGGWYLPLRSFLWLRGTEARLALLDPPETLEVRGLAADARPRLWAEGPRPQRLRTLDARVDVPFEVPCQDEAAARGDLSGGALCKRVRVSFRRPALDLYPARDRVVVAPLVPPAVTVDAACERGRTCGLADLQAAYFKDASLEVKPNVPLLWFGLTAAGGEPLAAHLRFGDDPRACAGSGPPCLIVGTRDGTFVHEAAGRLALGSPEGEQVFLRSTPLGVPWWLAAWLCGVLLAQAALLQAPAGEQPARLFALAASLLTALLAARALFGFKLLARHPHDPEGLAGTLLGWACLPVALHLAADVLDRRRLARAALALGVGLLALGLLRARGLVAIGDDLGLSLVLALGALLATAALLGWRGRWAWERLNAEPESWRWFALLLAWTGLRALLAAFGFERLFDVPLLALYWPGTIVLLGLVLRRVTDDGLRLPWWFGRLGGAWTFALLWTLAVVAQALPRGDTGAALVLGPPLLLALACVWGRQVVPLRGRALRAVPALLLLGIVGGVWARHQQLDRRYPQVAAEREWAVRDREHKGQDLLCPEDDEARPASSLDLAPHADVFAHGNLEVRRDDYLLGGAANRAGTRVGAEVHEFMAVLRRYAAGSSDDLAGAGYLSAEVRRYGAHEVQAQLADGMPSLLLASEGGSLAVLGLLALHGLLLHALVGRHSELLERLRGPDRALSFIALTAGGVPAWTTLLMTGGNFGVLPFTGQSTPLLVVLSGMDLIVAPTLWVLALVATRLAEERAASPAPQEAGLGA